MTSAADYRAHLAELAEDAGFAEGDPLRAGLMLAIACEWLQAKDEYILAAAERQRRVLGLTEPQGEVLWSPSPAGESQDNVTPIHREAHSHATKGRR